MSPSKSDLPSAIPSKVRSPSSLAHVVFVTPNLQRMVDFWTFFLGGSIIHSDDHLAFIRYDDEHHRIAIIHNPSITPRVSSAAGMHHVAFTFDTLTHLVETYSARKAAGIVPTRCINHGPTTSMYYEDPDGNKIETQVDNFDTVEEAVAFMEGPLFAENPIGTEFEPEELVAKLEAGISDKTLKKRKEIGKIGLPAEYRRKDVGSSPVLAEDIEVN